jgi:adenosylhomocysteinase
LSGTYSSGKTFFCSLVREEAWRRGFIVAAVNLSRDPPLQRFDVIFHRLMHAMRTDHIREVPVFEFILQEWLFNLEQEVQRSMGLNPLNPVQRSEVSRVIAERISEQLTELRIHDRSFANAVRSYYEASQQGHEATATAAVGWLMGDASIPGEVCKELQIRGRVDHGNALNFLQAVAALVVHIGYSGLIVIVDEAEWIRGISCPESRNQAYENIRLLMEKTTQGELAHCGFMLVGTEDLYHDALRGMASSQALYDRLKPDRARGRTTDFRQPVMALAGFDRVKMHEVALKVREAHGIAFEWDAAERLPDDRLKRLIEETAARFGEKFTAVPRGFLAGLVDILDDLQQSTPSLAGKIISAGIDADHIEAIDREETHLIDHI